MINTNKHNNISGFRALPRGLSARLTCSPVPVGIVQIRAKPPKRQASDKTRPTAEEKVAAATLMTIITMFE